MRGTSEFQGEKQECFSLFLCKEGKVYHVKKFVFYGNGFDFVYGSRGVGGIHGGSRHRR